MRHSALAMLTLIGFSSTIAAQTPPKDCLGAPTSTPPLNYLRAQLKAQAEFQDATVRPVAHAQEQCEKPRLPTALGVDVACETRSCVPASQFRAGAGFYYLRPYFDTNPAFAQSINVTTPTQAVTTTTQTNFDWGFRMAPLVWVEYVHRDLFGIRGRWWQFDGTPPGINTANLFNAGAATTQVTSAFPLGLGIISNPNGAAAGFNDSLNFQSGLLLNVWDIEITKELRAPIGWLAFSAGARYAESKQSYDAFLVSTPAVPGASTVISTLLSDHDFRGAGGTVALDAGFHLGDTGVSLFCTGRGSLLYGVGRERATLATATINPLGAITTQTLEPSATQDRVLPVGEIEIGAEYARNVGRFRFVLRAALANQIWFGAGNAANNQTITGSGTLLTVPVTQAADNHMNLGFLGLSTTLGIQY
jgi:hypothetical protein